MIAGITGGGVKALQSASVERIPDDRRAQRLDIQALRGVAVLAVLLYHLWPETFAGGYVGVDVFFVISGFLITDHIAREIERTGRLRLSRFWARRARRLLPAALLVAAVSVVGTLLVTPQTYWPQFMKEIAASVLYVENWALTLDAVDYLASENAASPVQHYWSLSVEEQFYLVWPLLAIAASMLALRFRRDFRAVLLMIIAGVFVASLAWSIMLVSEGSPIAYFGTHLRAWQFAAGAIVALTIGRRTKTTSRVGAGLAWLGVGVIVASVVFFDSSTPFPGAAALVPVLGAAAVIIANADRAPFSFATFGRRSGLTWLGDVSYAAYLWHWPLIIFAGFAVPEMIGNRLLAVILVVTLALAWLTTRFVEEPLRRRPLDGPRAIVMTLVVTLMGMLAVGGPAAGIWQAQTAAAASEVDRATELANALESCFGAGARVSGPECTPPSTTEGLTPDPAFAIEDTGDVYADGCIAPTGGAEVRKCEYGVRSGELSVALIGDSHATNWFPALEIIASERDWRLDTFLKSACPESSAVKENRVIEAYESCIAWNATMATGSHVQNPYDLVVVGYSAAADSYADQETAINGFLNAWQKYIDGGSTIVVMADNARNVPEVLECLEANEQAPSECAVDTEVAYPRPDNMVLAAKRIPGDAVVIDLTDIFCEGDRCDAAIGGAVVYRDSHHLTSTFAKTLAPIIAGRLDSALLAQRAG